MDERRVEWPPVTASIGGFLWWLVVKGYVIAYLLGAITVLQIGIVKNSRQIRRANETIRRALEAKLQGTPWNN